MTKIGNPRLISTYVSLPYVAMKALDELAKNKGKTKSEILRPWILERMKKEGLIE